MAELIVRRYAAALFDIAGSNNEIEQYQKEVEVILKSINDEPDFLRVLENQKITLDEKVSFVEKIFLNQISSSIVGLMVLIIKKGRQQFLSQIFEAFLEMVKSSNGILKATVTSAIQLKDSQLSTIKNKLEESVEAKVELEAVVDPSIIAGLIIRLGDKVVDASVQGKMQALKKELLELRLA